MDGTKMGSLFVPGLLLLVIRLIGAAASCPETVYLELGVDGIINCFYEDYQLINWSITGDTNALIVYRNNVRDGPGYHSGKYDLFLNGSLIIRNVTQQHERQYSLGVYTSAGDRLSSLITVRVFVRPIPGYPVINGMVNRQNLLLKVEKFWDMECAMENVRPAISLEWVIVDGSPPNNLVINNDTTTRAHGNGTFSIHLRSHFKMEDTSVQSLIILCVVIGPKDLSSNTSADVLFLPVSDDQSPDPVPTNLVPVIDGCYSKQLNCKQVMTSPTGRLPCTVMDVPTTDDVWIEWTPFGVYDKFEWAQTKHSNASGTVSRSLDYSIDEPSGTLLLEFQCRLFQRGFENVIGSADVTIEVQYNGVMGRHHRQTTALLALQIFVNTIILASFVYLVIHKRKLFGGSKAPGASRAVGLSLVQLVSVEMQTVSSERPPSSTPANRENVIETNGLTDIEYEQP